MPFPLALIPIATSLISSGIGAVNEGNQRAAMRAERRKWAAENDAMYNKDYYMDATTSPDAQNVIRQMRDQMKQQNKIDQNTAVVTGASPEAINANKDSRNKAMTSVFSNIAAMGVNRKERAKDRYLAQKTALQGMEYDDMAQGAQSSNNLLYNGLNSLGGIDWTTWLGSHTKTPALKGAIVDSVINTNQNNKPLFS